MPNYEYECDNCNHNFEIRQDFDDKPLKKCPECRKNKLRRVLFAPYVAIRGEPTTIGQLAEKNTREMGKVRKEEINQEYKEQKAKEKLELLKEKNYLPKDTVKLPDNPWYNDKGENLQKELKNVINDPKKVEKFIMTGEK
jgi:putative FmdB family regulatory protein